MNIIFKWLLTHHASANSESHVGRLPVMIIRGSTKERMYIKRSDTSSNYSNRILKKKLQQKENIDQQHLTYPEVDELLLLSA